MTKQELLSTIGQEAIMAKYLGLAYLPQGKFLSPFYPDTKAGCNLYYNKANTLVYKDWGSYDYGDCFKVAQIALGIESFPKLLEAISQDFSNEARQTIISKVGIVSGAKIGLKSNGISKASTKPTTIKVEPRDWSEEDKVFSDLGIGLRTLARFGVKALDKASITTYKSDEPYTSILVSSEDKPLYGYYLGGQGDGEIWKTYMPNGGNKKWRNNYGASNKPVVEGDYQLRYNDRSRHNGSTLVITKALKEVMWLYQHLDLAGVAGPSETSLIPEAKMRGYLKDYQEIYLLMDNDRAGQEATKKYMEAYPTLKPIYWLDGKNVTDSHLEIGLEDTVDRLWKLLA